MASTGRLVNGPCRPQRFPEGNHVQDPPIYGGYLDALPVQRFTGSKLVGQHVTRSLKCFMSRCMNVFQLHARLVTDERVTVTQVKIVKGHSMAKPVELQCNPFTGGGLPNAVGRQGAYQASQVLVLEDEPRPLLARTVNLDRRSQLPSAPLTPKGAR